MSKRASNLAASPVGENPRQDIVRGVQRGIPIVLGYLPLGFAYGVLAVQNGIPPIPAVLMSLFVFAGSGQFIAAGLWGMGASVLSIVFTTFVVNLRHLLMAASLAPWLRSFTRTQQALFGFELTDETFALHSSAMRSGETASLPLLYAANSTAHAGWIGGAVCGVLAGDVLPDPKLFGLDYALPAMFLALLLPQCLRRLHLFAALFAGLLSVGLALAGTGRWNIIIATLATATVGALLMTYRDRHLLSRKKRGAA
ncbi:MAG: AzlC family ABC transporter permease [Bilophila sp.]